MVQTDKTIVVVVALVVLVIVLHILIDAITGKRVLWKVLEHATYHDTILAIPHTTACNLTTAEIALCYRGRNNDALLVIVSPGEHSIHQSRSQGLQCIIGYRIAIETELRLSLHKQVV